MSTKDGALVKANSNLDMVQKGSLQSRIRSRIFQGKHRGRWCRCLNSNGQSEMVAGHCTGLLLYEKRMYDTSFARRFGKQTYDRRQLLQG